VFVEGHTDNVPLKGSGPIAEQLGFECKEEATFSSEDYCRHSKVNPFTDLTAPGTRVSLLPVAPNLRLKKAGTEKTEENRNHSNSNN